MFVRRFARNLNQRLEPQGIVLEATAEALDYLSSKGFDPQFGARPIKRLIQKRVLNQLSKELLAGRIQANSALLLDSFEDELVFRNQSSLEEV